MVYGLGSKVKSFMVKVLGIGIYGLGFRVYDLEFRDQGL